MKKKQSIAILTGGGDCPGLNAVIRAVTKKAVFDYDMDVLGIEDGYEGLVENRFRKLETHDVSGILTLGGTILGTSNKANPYKYAVEKSGEVSFHNVAKEAIRNIRKMGISCLVCVGGDGTLHIAHRLFCDGIPIVGVPKTIDNDIRGTEITFGFDTAVQIATEGIDRIHTTAQSHHRVMIVEVMGRRAGWLALHAGVAGGGDIILLPEIPYDLDKIAKKIKARSKKGKRFSIVVISEGAKAKGGTEVVKRIVKASTDPVRLGGVGFVLADQIEKVTGSEARAVVMGHLQRGGSPTSFDRVLATQLGTKAVDMIIRKEFGYMVGVQQGTFVNVSLKDVAAGPRFVPPDNPLIKSARSVGTCFGD
ncbi:MAG: ATP-dependent 6-phosphofructokinase [Candidatus Omnitrophota bacterium]